jgi:hypothetical protein
MYSEIVMDHLYIILTASQRKRFTVPILVQTHLVKPSRILRKKETIK